ncbi:MAG: B12-binding domain-containing radical SAM protein [Candidatus Pacearchaeota archaeon]|nr:B12-binding domain-containing radical SAM protein [Candidatus Pacearchaeota archaeon]
MRILLVEPNIEGYALMPSMALATLKSFINSKTEHKAEIADFIFHKRDWQKYLKHKIEKFRPDLIGFSVMSFDYSQARKMAKFIKRYYDTKIIFGGVHVILMPEQTIKNEEVDIICTCEGEYVLKDLLDKKLNCRNVKGVWYKNEKKEVIKNANRKLIEELDELPFPDFEDYELEKYFLINNNHLPIMGSRGCPYACTYCSNHAIKKKLEGKYVRIRSVDSMIKEIELRIKQYYNKGMKYLFFYDDTFILDKNFVFDFCKAFKEKGFDKKIKWNVNVRANLVTDEIIKTMKDAGCYEVRMGVEAGNNSIRNDLYKRYMTEEQIYNAVRIIKKYGLHLRVQFIVGAPYDTIETMNESYVMAKKINADYTLFPILMPLPETEIKDICEKENLIEKKGFRDSYTMFTSPVSRTKYATMTEIKRVVNKVRNYQIKKAFLEGVRMKNIKFFLDLFLFLVYYKRKYDLEIDNAFRFTVNKYYLEKISKK